LIALMIDARHSLAHEWEKPTRSARAPCNLPEDRWHSMEKHRLERPFVPHDAPTRSEDRTHRRPLPSWPTPHFGDVLADASGVAEALARRPTA